MWNISIIFILITSWDDNVPNTMEYSSSMNFASAYFFNVATKIF